MHSLRVRLLASVAVAAVVLPASSSAQQAPQPPAAVSTGPELTSGISVAEEYNDNIYAARTSKIPVDHGNQPFANLRRRGEKAINLGGNAAIGRYATYGNENYNDYSVYARGRYDPSSMLSLSGGTGYDHQHEPRSSPNARPGVTPTVYDVTRAFGAALIKPDEKSSVRIGGTFDRFDYDNVARVGGGTVINDDRDRDMITIGTRAGRLNDSTNSSASSPTTTAITADG
jgi:hypothetical protein